MQYDVQSTPLIESRNVYYYVLHFHNTHSTYQQNKSITLDQAKLILAQSFKLPSFSSKSASDSIHDFLQSRLSEFWLSHSSDSLPQVELHKFMMETTLCLLQDYLKITVDQFYSEDYEDIYLKLSTSELNFKLQAHLSDYHLQLRGIQNSPAGVVSPYLPYSLQLDNSASYEHSFQHYDQSDNEASPFELPNDKLSLFTSRDKIRLIHDMISSVIDLDYMLHSQVLQNHFPPHNLQQVEKLRKNWASNLRLWNFDTILEVRNYFGEGVALLYSCGRYYSVWMMIVAVVGIAIFIAGFVDGSRNYSYLGIGFAVFIVASACMVDIKWRRLEQRLRHSWGITEDHPTQQLTTYPGEYQEDQLTGKIKRVPTSSSFNYFRLLSISLTFTLTCLTLFLNYIIFFNETVAEKCSELIKHLLLAVQMQVIRRIFTRLSLRIGYYENVETYREYEQLVISRISIFNFVITMTPLAYILFLKGSVQGCENNDCISELSAVLLKIYLVKYKIYLFEKLVHLLIAKCKKHPGEISSMIRQKGMKRYSSPIEYYEEVVSNLGLVAIFSAFFPALPILALVLNVSIIKVDEWFLCYEYQRPTPHPTSSVRIWTSITQAQVFIAIFVNLWWIVEKLGGLMKVDKFYVMGVAGLVGIVVVCKMCADMQKIPEDVQKSIRWGERVVKERIEGKSLNYEVQNQIREKYIGNQLQHNRETFLGESEASLTSIP